MKVGTVVRLKVACLGNKAGSLGVVFYDYGDGFQAIFENGNYDGFSTSRKMPCQIPSRASFEAEYFLEEVGFEASLGGYQFINVLKVTENYIEGLFNIAWSERWKLKAALRIEQGATEEKHPTQALKGLAEAWRQSNEADEKSEAEPEYEKCKVYSHSHNSYVWLMFKRGNLPLMLSAAKDFVDFSHFEYEEMGINVESRWKQGNITICPLYVVFQKKEGVI